MSSRPLGRAWGGASNGLPHLGERMGRGFWRRGGQLPYKTKGKEEITQKDLQLFRASPHAPEWSGNIHESKLSDIHRPHPAAPAQRQAEKLQIQKVRLRR